MKNTNIKEEAYSAAAVLSQKLAEAAGYLGRKSGEAAETLRRKQAEATAQAAAARTAQAAAPDANEDDMSVMVTNLFRKARAEAPELAKEVTDEVKSMMTRLEGVIDRRREERARASTAATAQPEYEADPVADPKINHF